MEAFPTFRIKGVGQREMGPQGGGRGGVRESLSLQKRN